MRGWLTLTIVLIGGYVSEPTTALTDPLVAAIARAKRGICAVASMAVADTGRTITGEGSGFFVRPRTFVTAAHVVRVLEQQLATTPGTLGVIYLPTRGRTWDDELTWMKFDVAACRIDDTVDLALCDVVDTPDAVGVAVEPLTCNPERQADGSPVAFTGFPVRARRPLSARGTIAGYDPLGSEPLGTVLVDRIAWHGVSGAPLFNERAEVLGVMTKAGQGTIAGLSWGPSGRVLCRFLDEHPQ